MRRIGLAAAVATVFSLAYSGPASATVTASFASGTVNVNMSASGDVGRVYREGPTIRVDGVTITGSTPTVSNTQGIQFNDDSTGSVTAVIDHAGGHFGPGFDEGASADPEIEFLFVLDAGGSDLVRVLLDPAGQQVALGAMGMNLNAGEASFDGDTLGTDSVDAVEFQGRTGNDTITGSPGSGLGGPTSLSLTIDGGGGDDDLTGGAGADRIDGQDGDNNDVVSCRGGDDVAAVDFLDAVGSDCETINRTPAGGGPGGGGPGPGPGTGTTPGTARVTVPAGPLRARRGRVGVRVRCVSSPTGTCRGRVTLRRRIRGRLRTLGSARYSVAAGRISSVVVRLNGFGRRLLRSGRTSRVTLRVTIDRRTISRTVTIRR